MHKKCNRIIIIKQSECLDYEKLAKAICDAQVSAEKNKQMETEEKRKKAIADWQKALGLVNYEKSDKKYKNFWNSIKNGVSVFWNMMTLKRKYAKTDATTFALLGMALNSVFALIKWMLYLVSIVFMASSFYSFDDRKIISFEIAFVFYGVFSFVLARLVRVAQFEVYNMVEREYLMGLLSAVTSFVAVIIALIALFV